MSNATKMYEHIIYGDEIVIFETTRHKELEKLFTGSVKAIKNTVSKELKLAIEALNDMAFDLMYSAYHCGIARGIETAVNLQELLEAPYKVAELSDSTALPLNKAEALEVKAISAYLDKAQRPAKECD